MVERQTPTVQAVLWRDFLCPWCHLGRDRTALLESLGVAVVARAYDLHPDVPQEGRPVRPGGRLAAVLDHIAAECGAAGLPFRAPARIANSRMALETAELVRRDRREASAAVDAAFYDVQWVEGGDLNDPSVVDRVLASVGLDPAPVRRARAAGEGAALIRASMAEARNREVTGTPAWWLDDRLLVPGVQPRETLERWVRRLQERRPDAPRGGPDPR